MDFLFLSFSSSSPSQILGRAQPYSLRGGIIDPNERLVWWFILVSLILIKVVFRECCVRELQDHLLILTPKPRRNLIQCFGDNFIWKKKSYRFELTIFRETKHCPYFAIYYWAELGLYKLQLLYYESICTYTTTKCL